MTWTPLCLDDEERAAYLAGVLAGCRDCTAAFANDMRAIGRCNGIPGEVTAGIVKEEDMDQVPAIAPAGRRLPVVVARPACGSCVHDGICKIQDAVGLLERVEAKIPDLPRELTFTLSAQGSCSRYVKAKAAKPAAAPKTAAGGREERRVRILAAVERHSGDVSAAAAELGELPHVVARIRNAAQAREAVSA